ncbi:MAG: hypothetical protein B6D64_09890 [Bacteroidetes bacterium 4484_276]|nr:MAG: hypothetical protein B6D64_09890 [Bacteroidetes bacterium 4484_276]
MTIIFGLSSIAQVDLHDKGSYQCAHKKASNPHQSTMMKSPNTPKHKFDVLNYTLNLDLYDNFSSPYPQDFTASNIITFRVDTAIDVIKLNAVNSSLLINGVSMAGVSFSHQQEAPANGSLTTTGLPTKLL